MRYKYCPAFFLTLKVLMFFIILYPAKIRGQVSRDAYNDAKDAIVLNYNAKDYKKIYQLLDTSFTKKISEARFVNFLKGNQNSGKIISSSFLSEENGKVSYLLQSEMRDLMLDIQLTAQNKISSFGLRNKPPTILAAAPVVKSNNPNKTALDIAVDSIARDYFLNEKVNSLSIGIILNGRQYTYFYGELEKGEGGTPNANTLYEIGSITKTFTTTILAQAVLDKKLSLDDDIRKYLKGDFSNLTYQGKCITIRNLANHTGGFPTLPSDIGDYPDYDPVSPESHYDSTRFYHALKAFRLDTVSGFKFLYSNWGNSILGHILETVYHQSLSALFKHFITDKLKMNRTGYLNHKKANNIAFPHSENGRRLAFAQMNYFYPAGGLHSTIYDMMSYLDAQLRETNSAIQLTHVPTANNMGLGWGVIEKNGIRHLEHNGMVQGSSSHISAFPEINSGCVILANNRNSLGKVIRNIQRILNAMASK